MCYCFLSPWPLKHSDYIRRRRRLGRVTRRSGFDDSIFEWLCRICVQRIAELLFLHAPACIRLANGAFDCRPEDSSTALRVQVRMTACVGPERCRIVYAFTIRWCRVAWG